MVYPPVDGVLCSTRLLWDQWRLRHAADADRPLKPGMVVPGSASTRASSEAIERIGSGAAYPDDRDHPVYRPMPEMRAGLACARDRNHRVVAVTAVAGDNDVNCLSVPEAGNFALGSAA